MKLENAITNRILYLCKEREITPNKLASIAGLPSSTIRCIFYGKSKSPGTRTLLDICDALDISLYDFSMTKCLKIKHLKVVTKQGNLPCFFVFIITKIVSLENNCVNP